MILRLAAGEAVAEIGPEAGGGLVSLEVGGRPVLCSGTGRPQGSPFALAMNLLLPFSNRISRPFRFDGEEHALEPNLPGEPFPIHGDAFQRRWSPTRHHDAEAVLRLADGRFGPFAYEAEVAYRLLPSRLEVTLGLTSRADRPLPHGLGFHPWFPRTPSTRARFRAEGCWPQDHRHLPATDRPVPSPPAWRFEEPAPLPRGWINTAFSGWDGEAEVLLAGDAVPLRLLASGLSTLIVYSPSAEAPFFCLEPVSHPVDAHNLPGQPGLRRLAPGESLAATMALEWGDGPA